jgi:hypothetical protein
MKRKIYQDLCEWKARDDRKPLILLGARQVGKTWIMKEFGKTQFESVVYLNCDEEPLSRELFDADYNIQRILMSLQAISGVKIEPDKTLIIFDELQSVPRGLHALKYFQENAPQYHIIAAGSLLGITLGGDNSFPVGKVDMLRMYPMNFFEFLSAMGQDALLELLQNSKPEHVAPFRNKLIDLLRQYYYVGGMPEVVARFIKNGDLQEVRRLQGEIISAYRNDIAKHTGKNLAVRIGQVLDAIPSQLAKENKKFIYSLIRKGARAAEYELAIQWLVDAGIVHKVSRVKELRMPVKFYEDPMSFKLFLLDCGLLGCLVDAPASQMLIGDNVFVEFKGSFTEQFVFQQLTSIGLHPYYWSNDRTTAEIDFVVQTPQRVIPIEVKAEENVKARSLSNFIHSNPQLHLKGVRISMRDYKDQGWMENYPLYYFLPAFNS